MKTHMLYVGWGSRLFIATYPLIDLGSRQLATLGSSKSKAIVVGFLCVYFIYWNCSLSAITSLACLIDVVYRAFDCNMRLHHSHSSMRYGMVSSWGIFSLFWRHCRLFSYVIYSGEFRVPQWLAPTKAIGHTGLRLQVFSISGIGSPAEGVGQKLHIGISESSWVLKSSPHDFTRSNVTGRLCKELTYEWATGSRESLRSSWEYANNGSYPMENIGWCIM